MNINHRTVFKGQSELLSITSFIIKSVYVLYFEILQISNKLLQSLVIIYTNSTFARGKLLLDIQVNVLSMHYYNIL